MFLHIGVVLSCVIITIRYAMNTLRAIQVGWFLKQICIPKFFNRKALKEGREWKGTGTWKWTLWNRIYAATINPKYVQPSAEVQPCRSFPTTKLDFSGSVPITITNPSINLKQHTSNAQYGEEHWPSMTRLFASNGTTCSNLQNNLQPCIIYKQLTTRTISLILVSINYWWCWYYNY